MASEANPVNLSEAQDHPAFSFRPETGEEIYHSFLGVPILRAGNTLGVLVVQNRAPRTYSEDFAYYSRQIPGFYVFLGVNPPATAEEGSAPNHSPRFFVDESALVLGVRTWCTLALDYLTSGGGSAPPASGSSARR